MRRPLAALVLCLAAGSHGLPSGPAQDPYQAVQHVIGRDAFEALRPAHRTLLLDLANRRASGELPPLALCWSERAPESLGDAIDLLTALEPAFQFEDGDRWSATATDGAGLGRGDPTTLTWGFLPDGVTIPGEGGTPSSLILVFDNQFGSGPGGTDYTLRPWFTHFEQAMNRWGELIGIDYVYEPDDDGASFPWSPGVLGVRPDVRIGGHSIDGTSGSNIYAYNYFPDIADMVIDTDNHSTFGNAAGDYVLLRNLIHHEHGHGLGLNHTCPDDMTKVMEAVIRTNFDGPQLDDILGGSRGYGDALEFPVENDAFTAASNLGNLGPFDVVALTNLSVDGHGDDDWFALTLPERMRLHVTMQPTGVIYWDAIGSLGGCPFGPSINSLVANNLGFDVYGTSGTNLLVSPSGNPAGQPETLTDFLLLDGPGTYYVRVFSEIAVDEAQLYDLDILIHPGQAPVAQCRNIKICSNNPAPNRVNNGSYDPDGDPITLSLDPPGPYPPGPNAVNLIVDDGVLQDTCQAVITVNRPPDAACKVIQVEGDSAQGCTAAGVTAEDLDDGTEDPDGDAVSLTLVPPGPFDLGSHQVLFIAEDTCGEADTCTTTITVVCPGLVGIPGEGAGLFRLLAASPNPFRTGTQVAFVLEEPGYVDLAVYDARGRRLRGLISGDRGPGEYRVAWDGTDDRGARGAAGLYFLRLLAGGRSDVQKVVLSP